MQRRPKVLFVAGQWPMAAEYGTQQRILNLARLLGRFGDVSLAIALPVASDEEIERRTKREFNVCRTIRILPVTHGTLFSRLHHRLRYELNPFYLMTDLRTVSSEDRAAMLELINKHDLIWVHRLELANLFGIYKWPHTILDLDDVPSRFYNSSVQSGHQGWIRRLLERRMSWLWQRRERLLTQRFDALIVCNEDDRQYLGNQSQIYVIPNGFNPPAMLPRIPSEPPRIGFIGNLQYLPNAEGIKWFLRDIWPRIKQDFPTTRLRLIGRGSNSYFHELGPDIDGLGWLEDVGEEIASWSVMIVPINFGGGTRIKIAEGFARECPVVATSFGAFGYDVRNGKEILLADSSRDFASACSQLLRNPRMGEAVAASAHKRFLQQWTWDSHEGSVGHVIQECLSRSIHPVPCTQRLQPLL